MNLSRPSVLGRGAVAGLFLLLAVGVHLALAAAVLQRSGPGAQAAGEGGDMLFSLQAANLGVAEMVAEWERPVTAPVEATRTPSTPTATEAAPRMRSVSEEAPKIPEISAPDAPPLPGVERFDAPAEPMVPKRPETEPAAEQVQVPAPEPKAAPAGTRKPVPRPAQVIVPKPAEAPQVKAPRAAAPKAVQGADHESPATRAAGTGGGANAGADQRSNSGSLSAADRKSALANWSVAIARKIARSKRSVRGANGESVKLVVTIARSGALVSVRVLQGSGNATIDAAAVSAARRAGRFPAAPKGVAEAQYDFVVPLRFTR